MDIVLKKTLAESMRGFHLPRYAELPAVGLYLEQTVTYINHCLAPLGHVEITGSMIRNYVKMGLVNNPVHKQYHADQIAHLMAITILKHVLPLEYIQEMFARQQRVYTDQVAYDYFCTAVENILYFRFGMKDTIDEVGVTSSLEKEMLRSAVTAVSHIVYLNRCFLVLEEQKQENGILYDLK